MEKNLILLVIIQTMTISIIKIKKVIIKTKKYHLNQKEIRKIKASVLKKIKQIIPHQKCL